MKRTPETQHSAPMIAAPRAPELARSSCTSHYATTLPGGRRAIRQFIGADAVASLGIHPRPGDPGSELNCRIATVRYGPIDCGIVKHTPHTFATTGTNFGHNHPVSRLIILLDGSQRISWGNEERTLSPGAGAFLPGDIAIRHDTWSVTTHAYLDIASDDPGLGPILRHLPPGCWPSEAPTLVALGAFVRSLVRREEKCVTWASRAAMRHALEAMVSTALSSFPPADTQDHPTLTPRELALQYIRTHYSNPALTPCSVARQLGLSVRTLQRSFEGEQSLVQWIAHFRLERALVLLQDPQLTRLTLPEIAARAGFGSTAVLRRAVSAATGVLPSEYREMHLNTLPEDN